MLTAFISLSTPDTYVSDIATWSVPIFEGLLVLALSFAGIVIGALVIMKLSRSVINAINQIAYPSRKTQYRNSMRSFYNKTQWPQNRI